MSDTIQVNVIVTGRVQGVFFRAETQKAALRIGVNGYVKNLADGSVKAVIQGSQDHIDQMLTWCQSGSPMSQVDQVLSETVEPETEFDSFDIRY